MVRRASRSAEPQDKLTEAEWAIMRVVWEKQPCAAGTVQDALERSRNWAYSTVKTTMDRMVAKGLLSIQTIRNLNLFTASVTEVQAKRGELRTMLQRAFDGTLTPMMRFLIENEDLSEEELKQLRHIVNKARATSRTQGGKA